MIKNLGSVAFIAAITLCVFFFCSENVYAAECDTLEVESSDNFYIDDMVDTELFENGRVEKFDDGTVYWISNDAPDNIIEQVSMQSTSYTSKNFGTIMHVQNKIAGSTQTIADIDYHGTIYYYTDGKVHLYSMGTDVTTYYGYTYTIYDTVISNTDGSISNGRSTVDLNSLIYGSSTWVCSAYVLSGNSYPTVKINQVA